MLEKQMSFIKLNFTLYLYINNIIKFNMFKFYCIKIDKNKYFIELNK